MEKLRPSVSFQHPEAGCEGAESQAGRPTAGPRQAHADGEHVESRFGGGAVCWHPGGPTALNRVPKIVSVVAHKLW